MRWPSKLTAFLICYGLLLVAADLILPLRVVEILQILAAWHFSWSGFMGWIAQTPGSAPLSYVAQLPFLLISPNGRLAARFASLIFAIGTCILIFSIGKKVAIKRLYLGLAAFVLLPVHFRAATDARGFEQALFLTVLQLLFFFRLIHAPAIKNAVMYGLALTFCLFTDPYSFLPAIGQFLFILRFINRAHERRVLWFALPATALPPLLFLPYYLWARTQTSPNWIYVPEAPMGDWTFYAIAVLLILGLLIGIWISLPALGRNPSNSIFLFCAAGGAAGSLIARQVLWATPVLILLFFAALDWISTSRLKNMAACALASLLLVCCVFSGVVYLRSRPDDMEREAAAVANRVTKNSCIVFLSEGLSKYLFLLFEPQLAPSECLNFFHRRAIVAIHPYVAVKDRKDVTSYFHALNFWEKERVYVGGGEIIVFQQTRN